MYFGSVLGLTGVMVGMLRNSSLAYMNPWVLLLGSLGLMFGTMYTNYH
jgi:hypothetical protein